MTAAVGTVNNHIAGRAQMRLPAPTAVAPPLVITFPTTAQTFTVGDTGSIQFVSSGGTAPVVWAKQSGTYPTGVTAITSAGVLAYNMTAEDNDTVVFKATDADGTVVTVSIEFTINAAVTGGTLGLWEPPQDQGQFGITYTNLKTKAETTAIWDLFLSKLTTYGKNLIRTNRIQTRWDSLESNGDGAYTFQGSVPEQQVFDVWDDLSQSHPIIHINCTPRAYGMQFPFPALKSTNTGAGGKGRIYIAEAQWQDANWDNIHIRGTGIPQDQPGSDKKVCGTLISNFGQLNGAQDGVPDDTYYFDLSRTITPQAGAFTVTVGYHTGLTRECFTDDETHIPPAVAHLDKIAAFARHIAMRLRCDPRIAGNTTAIVKKKKIWFEIFNESSAEGSFKPGMEATGGAAHFAKMAKWINRAIKQVDPEMFFVMGGVPNLNSSGSRNQYPDVWYLDLIKEVHSDTEWPTWITDTTVDAANGIRHSMVDLVAAGQLDILISTGEFWGHHQYTLDRSGPYSTSTPAAPVDNTQFLVSPTGSTTSTAANFVKILNQAQKYDPSTVVITGSPATASISFKISIDGAADLTSSAVTMAQSNATWKTTIQATSGGTVRVIGSGAIRKIFFEGSLEGHLVKVTKNGNGTFTGGTSPAWTVAKRGWAKMNCWSTESGPPYAVDATTGQGVLVSGAYNIRVRSTEEAYADGIIARKALALMAGYEWPTGGGVPALVTGVGDPRSRIAGHGFQRLYENQGTYAANNFFGAQGAIQGNSFGTIAKGEIKVAKASEDPRKTLKTGHFTDAKIGTGADYIDVFNVDVTTLANETLPW